MSGIKEIEAGIRKAAAEEGYTLNPDDDIRTGIIEGIASYEERLGYRCCPCRKASGDREADQDIICPCAYRDADLDEFGRCYCALYVTQQYLDKGSPPGPIPERRLAKSVKKIHMDANGEGDLPGSQGGIKVWRCTVCGYLCARAGPPQVCPICKAGKDKFEHFIF